MADTTEVQSGGVEVAGAPLHYEVAGTGSALVLLHEGLADSRMYDEQFAALAQQHRVVRYDLHGFGQSGTPTQAYSHHAVLHALLQHLGISCTALLGMSMGGGIAIDFTLSYPEMVSALLLFATGMGGYPPGETRAAAAAPMAEMAEAFKAGDFVRAIDLSVRMWVDGSERRPDEVNAIVRERFRSLYIDVLRRSRENGRQGELLDPPAYTRLAEIRVPTLVVVGTGDIPVVLEQADVLAQNIKGARKVVMPHLGHLFNMEQPAEVNRLILDFLAEQDRAR